MMNILFLALLSLVGDTVLARPLIPRDARHTTADSEPPHSREGNTTNVGRSHIISSDTHRDPEESIAPSITVDRVDIETRDDNKLVKRQIGCMPGDTNIALINGTPYRWRRIHIHQYQMKYWFQWPEYIEPGQAITHQAWTYRGWGSAKDTAGEVTYHLEGTEEPMSFEVRYKAKGLRKFEVNVRFKGELETDTTPKNRAVELAPKAMPGGSSFLLSGKEGSLMSSADWNNDDADNAGWMQSLLPGLGRQPLREIIMVRSHHAALEDNNFSVKNMGSRKENTVTQIHPVSRQLRMDGVRVLDTRVLKYEGDFYEAHGTYMNNQWYGAIGEKLENVIERINDFNDEYPGELIIWDFHQVTWNNVRGYQGLSTEDRKEFYHLLKRVKHRAAIPNHEDVTLLPLEDFIGNKTSSVVLRFHESWAEATPKTFPGLRQGFTHTGNFPIQSSWRGMYDLDEMTKYQLEKLGEGHSQRRSKLFDQQWLRGLTGLHTVFIPNNLGLIDMGRTAMVTLREQLWNRMTDQVYPNWITVDTVDGGELRWLVKTMNRCFVLRQCGDWVKKPRS